MVEPVYPHYRQGKKPRQIRRERRGSLDLGPEAAIQYDFFAWVDLNKKRFPALALIFAIPNGSKLSRAERAVMSVTGLRPGVPDICVPWMNIDDDGTACTSLWIEFKSEKGKPTAEQSEWHEKLRDAGHRVEIHRSWITAANVVIDYLKLPLEKIPE